MEFNLSEKIELAKFRLGVGHALHKLNVKEFIKLLKDWYYLDDDDTNLNKFLKKYAGDKLL